MKIEIDNQTTITLAAVFLLFIFEFLMAAFKVNRIVNISMNITLCIFFNIYNYKRFRGFHTKKELLLTNKRFGFALLFINLPFITGVLIILIPWLKF